MGGHAGGRWLPQKISYHEMMLRMTPDEKHDVGHRAPTARHRGLRTPPNDHCLDCSLRTAPHIPLDQYPRSGKGEIMS